MKPAAPVTNVFIAASSYLFDRPVSERHQRQAAAQKNVHGVLRPIDDRFAMQIEGSVQQDAFPGTLFIVLEQAVVVGIVRREYFLRSRREIGGMLGRFESGARVYPERNANIM